MNVRDHRQTVAAKRDGRALDDAEVEAFIEGYAQGSITDALASAFLMACVIRGLDRAETSP